LGWTDYGNANVLAADETPAILNITSYGQTGELREVEMQVIHNGEVAWSSTEMIVWNLRIIQGLNIEVHGADTLTEDEGFDPTNPFHYGQTPVILNNFYGGTAVLNTLPPQEEEPEYPEGTPLPVEPPEYYYVSVSAGSGGQVTPRGDFEVPVGTTFWAHATANVDYAFDYWSRNGSRLGTSPNISINDGYVNAHYQLIARFISNPPVEPDEPEAPDAGYYSVNIGTAAGGTLSLSGEQTVLAGEPLTVTITPHANYRFNYWLLDGSNWGTSRTFTLTGTADTTYTLLPVLQPIPSLPRVYAVALPNVNGGTVTRNKLLKQLLKQSNVNFKPVNLSKLLRKLGS